MKKLAKYIMIAAVCLVMAGCGISDQDYIDFVKGGHPNLYPDISYEEAFGAYFPDGEWEYFKSADDEDVVEFTGTILYYGENTRLRIKFLLDYEGGTFETYTLLLDGIEQSNAMLLSVITEIFGDYQAENGGGDQQSAGNDFIGGLSDGGTETDSAGRTIYRIGDTVLISWPDGRSANIAFLDWGIDYSLMDNSRIMYVEYEVTNTGTEDISVGNNWFSFYADNYLVEQSYWAKSDMAISFQTLSAGRSIRGRVYGDINPDTASVIEIEFADAVLVVKDETAVFSGMWDDDSGVPNVLLEGFYVGYMYYDMSITIYSSQEDGIGNVTLYQGENMVYKGELYKIDETLFWAAFPEETCYLHPYYEDGVLYMDLTDLQGDYIDIFYLQERYTYRP